MRTFNSWLAMLALTLGLSACGGFFTPIEDETEGWSAQRLYSEGKASLDGADYSRAIELYEKLESRFPFGTLALQAQLDIAYAHYKADETASAIAAADRFIKLHPRHPNVDYAYYLKGLVHFNEGKTILDRLVDKDYSERDPAAAEQSFESFAELVRRFPNSIYASDAAQRMLFLKNTLAEYELHVADYYMRRGAYLAATNRARYVVENYQRTPAVPDALAVMVDAYHRLELDALATDSARVLKLNYPDHAATDALALPEPSGNPLKRAIQALFSWAG